MGTYAGIYCKTCNESNEDWKKSGWYEAWEAIRTSHLLSMLLETVHTDVTIEIGYFNDCAYFAASHHGHELVIRDEYGYEGRTLDEYYNDRNKILDRSST